MGRDRLGKLQGANKDWRDKKVANARLAYERRIVRKLLTTIGVTPLQLRTQYEPKWKGSENENFYLTFGWFHQEFERFPVKLMPLVPDPTKELDITVDDFFFPRSKLWKMWKDVEEALGDSDDAYGAVVSTQSRLGEVIMYTSCPATDHRDGEERYTFVRYNPTTCLFVHMERLDLFSRRIADVWKT